MKLARFACKGHDIVRAESAQAAAQQFATLQAKAEFGPQAYAIRVRPTGPAGGDTVEFEAFIGAAVPHEMGVTKGRRYVFDVAVIK